VFHVIVGVDFPQERSHNTYKIQATDSALLKLCEEKDRITKLTSTSTDMPVPNPDYLGLHAACCRVAHMSGAGEYRQAIRRS